MELEIANIVATVKLSAPLDKDRLIRLKNTELPLKGKWLKMRLMPEKYYIALYYDSGKFLIIGLKSLEKVEEIANRVLQILIHAGFDIYKESITVQNMVMMGTLKLNTNFEKIIYSLDDAKVSYEPEQFHCLIYKDFGVSFLLFPSGKFIINGIKSSNEGFTAAEKFSRLIQEIY